MLCVTLLVGPYANKIVTIWNIAFHHGEGKGCAGGSLVSN